VSVIHLLPNTRKKDREKSKREVEVYGIAIVARFVHPHFFSGIHEKHRKDGRREVKVKGYTTHGPSSMGRT